MNFNELKTDRLQIEINKQDSKIQINDLIHLEQKEEKKRLGLYFTESHIKKLKTLAETNNMNLSTLFHNILSDLLHDTIIDNDKVNAYDNRHKGKGKNLSSSNDTINK